MVSLNIARHAAPDDLSPYNAFSIISTVPRNSSNSVPAIVQIRSLQVALRYAFPISAARRSMSLSAACNNTNLTESRATTDE